MSRYDGRRQFLQRTGRPTYRLCRYADDMVLLVNGTKQQAQALLDQLAERAKALGLKLKAEKTRLTHIDEGFVFLGQRIIRRPEATEALRLHLRLQRGARLRSDARSRP